MPRKQAEEVFLYTFYIALFDIDPVIWRRFSVPSNITFDEFHEVIQLVMGWENYHLYNFKYGPMEIGIPDEEENFVEPGGTFLDADEVHLSSIGLQPDDVMTYFYDFGDNWVHLLRLEFISAMDKGNSHAFHCESGARACPPEDVGGPYGYDLHVKALADPTDAEHEDALRWRGPYEADAFHLESVNELLKAQFDHGKGKKK